MTFTVRQRGAHSSFTLAEYLCPEHGRFEVLVERDERGDPPAAMPCEHGLSATVMPGRSESGWVCRIDLCSLPSPWTISAPAVHTQFVVTASHGRNDPKPHADAMDTRLIAEGRKKEFRMQRKQVKEQRRKQRVMELLK